MSYTSTARCEQPPPFLYISYCTYYVNYQAVLRVREHCDACLESVRPSRARGRRRSLTLSWYGNAQRVTTENQVCEAWTTSSTRARQALQAQPLFSAAQRACAASRCRARAPPRSPLASPLLRCDLCIRAAPAIAIVQGANWRFALRVCPCPQEAPHPPWHHSSGALPRKE